MYRLVIALALRHEVVWELMRDEGQKKTSVAFSFSTG
jgi:hypothetical protein